MRLVLVVAVASLLSGLLAACGSDDELSQEEFLAQANEICRAGNAELEQLVEETFPTTDDEAEFLAFVEEEGPAFIDAFVSNVQGQIADIRGLNAPSDLEDEVDQVLDDASEVIDTVADGSPEEFILSEENPFADVDPQLEALGLTTCAE